MCTHIYSTHFTDFPLAESLLSLGGVPILLPLLQNERYFFVCLFVYLFVDCIEKIIIIIILVINFSSFFFFSELVRVRTLKIIGKLMNSSQCTISLHLLPPLSSPFLQFIFSFFLFFFFQLLHLLGSFPLFQQGKRLLMIR